jgi:hypothetical protein
VCLLSGSEGDTSFRTLAATGWGEGEKLNSSLAAPTRAERSRRRRKRCSSEEEIANVAAYVVEDFVDGK